MQRCSHGQPPPAAGVFYAAGDSLRNATFRERRLKSTKRHTAQNGYVEVAAFHTEAPMAQPNHSSQSIQARTRETAIT
jgi:hypothetical protein